MKFGDILSEKVGRRREWSAKFNQGANGAQTCIKFFAALPVPPLFRLRGARMRYPVGKAQTLLGEFKGEYQ